MVHPALFRASLVSGTFADHSSPIDPADWALVRTAKQALRRLVLAMNSGYRPERHYMRGGRTPGARSLAAR